MPNYRVPRVSIFAIVLMNLGRYSWVLGHLGLGEGHVHVELPPEFCC